jgi:hypothetical protein
VTAAAIDAVDEELVRQLTERARAEGLQLTGEGGLLQKLTKLVMESALDGELDDHLGYGKHVPAGRDGGSLLGNGLKSYGLCPPPANNTVLDAIDGLEDNIVTVIEAVQAKAPGAPVLLVNYLTVLPQTAR